MDAKILQDGPFADEINEANQTINHNLRLLTACEGDIGDARRDVDAMVRLRARRDALTAIVAALRADRDILFARRLDQIAQEARDQREAAFADVPASANLVDSNDPNTTIFYRRFNV